MNFFSVGKKADLWPLDLVMVRSEGIRKAAFRGEPDGKSRVNVCVCVPKFHSDHAGGCELFSCPAREREMV